MKHIVVDLEMNKIDGRFPERTVWNSETIEIGAVMLDESFREISSFRTYVRPVFCDGIARKITRLTGITDACVSQAPDFNAAFRMFTSWCLGTGDEITVYAWSDSDYNQIIHEMALKGYEPSEEEGIVIDSAWEDFQKRFDDRLGFERQISLATVGYGDIYPVSTAGRIVTMMSAIVGIAIVALPSGIITAGYMEAINASKEEKKNDTTDSNVDVA